MINGSKYIDELKSKMLPSGAELLPEARLSWHFQDDNATCHRAKIVRKQMGSTTLRCQTGLVAVVQLVTENWIDCEQEHAKDKAGTDRMIISAWHHVITEELVKLIKSMPRRCKMVIENKGWPIKYCIPNKYKLNDPVQGHQLCNELMFEPKPYSSTIYSATVNTINHNQQI